MRRPFGVVRSLVALGALGVVPAAAHGQDSAGKVDALEKRVADLEAKLAAGGTGGGDMKWNEFQKLGTKWTLGGWLRLDTQYDDSRMDKDQTPMWVVSEDPKIGATGAKNNSSELTIHPKMTRLWLDMDGPKVAQLGEAKTSGRLEMDFYNSTSTDSRQALRIRVAYLKLGWDNFSLYAGQMWDVISPLRPEANQDQVMWNTGNLADRRPQVRLEATPAFGSNTKLNIQGMVGQTGAVDASDNDATGTGKGLRDGDQSGQPTFQARIGLKQTLNKEMKDFEFGVWAHHASEETDAPVGGDRNFVSGVYGLDVIVPLMKKTLWLQGELWHGRNLDDVRGGIGQGINTTTGTEIRSEGGWGEIDWQATPEILFAGGYTLDNPNNDDLASGGRDRNAVGYGAVRFNYQPVTLGLEYLHWVTGYKNFDKGDANRVAAFIQYKF